MYWSNTTLFDVLYIYIIYYIKINYMFRSFTMAIFRLRLIYIYNLVIYIYNLLYKDQLHVSVFYNGHLQVEIYIYNLVIYIYVIHTHTHTHTRMKCMY